MDGPGGHYVKWNEPGTARKTPRNLIDLWTLQKLILQKAGKVEQERLGNGCKGTATNSSYGE